MSLASFALVAIVDQNPPILKEEIKQTEKINIFKKNTLLNESMFVIYNIFLIQYVKYTSFSIMTTLKKLKHKLRCPTKPVKSLNP